jgi:hypothetical protein
VNQQTNQHAQKSFINKTEDQSLLLLKFNTQRNQNSKSHLEMSGFFLMLKNIKTTLNSI